MNSKPFLRLQTSLTVTFALALLVVLAGATVRATGSGMGCPDWPLCYGCWIPPVSVDQLPADYAEKYAVAGRPAEFDAVKTWIEYINRLLGVLIGLSLVLTALLTLWVVRRRPSLGLLVMLSLADLAFVAWLGARVVDTFLAPYAVTLHLVAAFSLLGLLLSQREIVARWLKGPRPRVSRSLVAGLVALGLAFVLQSLLGIRTREEVEAWIWGHDLAESLWETLGGAYDVHKVSGVMVALVSFALAGMAWRRRGTDLRISNLTLACAALVVVQGLLGLILWWGDLPAWAKPLHLLVATVTWSTWFAAALHCLPSGAKSHV